MKYIKYFIQFLFVIIFYFFFKILGAKISSAIGGKIFQIIGPFFRSKNVIYSNIKKAFPEINKVEVDKITSLMWNKYGRGYAEELLIKDYRDVQLASNIKIDGIEILNEIKKQKNL